MGEKPSKTLEKLGCEKYAMAKITRVNTVNKNIFCTSEKTLHFTITKNNRLTLFKVINANYSVNHTEARIQNAALLTIKADGTYTGLACTLRNFRKNLSILFVFRYCDVSKNYKLIIKLLELLIHVCAQFSLLHIALILYDIPSKFYTISMVVIFNICRQYSHTIFNTVF